MPHGPPDPLSSALAALTPTRRAVYRAWWTLAQAGQGITNRQVAAMAGTTRAGVSSAIQYLSLVGLLPRREAHSHGIDPEWAKIAAGRLALLGETVAGEEPPTDSPAPRSTMDAGFFVHQPPSVLPPVSALLARRREEYERKQANRSASRLIPVDVYLDGPIGIVHMGDPHIDDSGTDIVAIERDVQTINNTPGLFGANVGDNNNNWVGRLAQLFGAQETSAAEAWLLVEWLVRSTPWLYLLSGNHGCWSGAGDPLQWMISHAGVFSGWGARLELRFPNGKKVRVNARHDFKGTSQYNNAHGPMKAALMGWRDHILTCGHIHTSGYGPLKCPATGLISHALRVPGYKRLDDYAEQGGYPDGNISPAVTTIIDPRWPDDSPRLIQVYQDTEQAAEYLTWLRGRK